MNGILIIDKPAGFTSHDVVAKVRRILRTRSVGHTGTLDPFATGVLVVLVGKATRLAQFLDKAEKEYLATIQFGFETNTGDCTGEPKSQIADLKFEIELEKLETILAKFRGTSWQTPPMYSAKKIAGKKLYELARKGVEIEREPVKINISKLEIEPNEQRTANNKQLTIRVCCSAGTYVRVLAEDIGRELGIGAHLTELRRTNAGSFDLQSAVTLEQLEQLAADDEAEKALISPNAALADLPPIELSETEIAWTKNGRTIFPQEGKTENLSDGQFVKLIDAEKNLIAVGFFNATDSSVRPKIVLLND